MKEKLYHISTDGSIERCKNKETCSIEEKFHAANRNTIFQKFSEGTSLNLKNFKIITESEALHMIAFVEASSEREYSQEEKFEILSKYDERLFNNSEIELMEVSEILSENMELFPEDRRRFYNSSIDFEKFNNIDYLRIAENCFKVEMAEYLITSVIQLHKEALNEIGIGHDIVWQLMEDFHVTSESFPKSLKTSTIGEFSAQRQGMVIAMAEALIELQELFVPERVTQRGFKIIFESFMKSEKKKWDRRFFREENDFNSGALDAIDEYLEEYIPAF